MQFPWGMSEASLGVAGTPSPPTSLSLSHSPPPPPPRPPPPPPLLHAMLSKPQVGVAETKRRFGSITYLRGVKKKWKENAANDRKHFVTASLKNRKPVTQVSLKRVKNESSAVRHPPSSEAGTQHASNIICLTRNAARLLSLNNETRFASIRFRWKVNIILPLE